MDYIISFILIRSAILSKVSIIIPIYNTKEYIEDCIQSLVNQIYKNIEIILVDDHSEEETRELLEKLAHQYDYIHLYRFDRRKGAGAARNFGMEQATGDLIYFMDSDDYIPEETLGILVQHIKNYPIIRGRVHETSFGSSFTLVFDGLNHLKMFCEDKYKLLKRNSVHNFLIRKDFIDDYHLRFSEEVDVYSDLAFIIPALENTFCVPYLREAVYFYRERQDPIENPSLSQQEASILISDFLTMYHQLKKKYNGTFVNAFLDKQFLNFYRKEVVTYFNDPENIDSLFQALSESVKSIKQRNLKEYDYFLKRELRHLGKGNVKRYKRINHQHHFLRDMREGFQSREKFYNFLYKRFFTKLKKKPNYIFFESFQGKSYSDSPKYIYEHMLAEKMDYTFIWSLNEQHDLLGNPKQVKHLSLKYYYYLARCKYWVVNARMPNDLDKEEGTVYLQTWHGTPLKRLAGDMGDVYMPGTNSALYKRNFYRETQKWDYLISPNAYSTQVFKSAFWFDNPMLEVGYPRNDVLYNKNTEEEHQALKRKLNLPLDKKVLLYAPTWRDDEFYSKGNYRFTLQLDLQKMQDELGDEYIILLRMHYVIASQLDISEFKGFAYDYSDYDDISELYLVSDVLITDYSSVFFDYANLKRPILFYTYDLEKYRDTLRGFYIDMEKEVPGPLLENTDEIIHAIETIDEVEEAYHERYDMFYNRFCRWDDGQAAKQAVERVFVDR